MLFTVTSPVKFSGKVDWDALHGDFSWEILNENQPRWCSRSLVLGSFQKGLTEMLFTVTCPGELSKKIDWGSVHGHLSWEIFREGRLGCSSRWILLWKFQGRLTEMLSTVTFPGKFSKKINRDGVHGYLSWEIFRNGWPRCSSRCMNCPGELSKKIDRDALHGDLSWEILKKINWDGAHGLGKFSGKRVTSHLKFTGRVNEWR